ncbi:MAG: T9SS type A sorting domain-containing protein [Bacteroidota bacterium]
MKKLFCLAILLSFFASAFAQNVQLATIEAPSVSTVTVEKKQEEVLKAVFPNPVKYSFILKVDRNALLSGRIDFQLFNADGDMVFEKRLGQPFEIIERGHLPEGDYKYQVKKEGETVQTGEINFQPF